MTLKRKPSFLFNGFFSFLFYLLFEVVGISKLAASFLFSLFLCIFGRYYGNSFRIKTMKIYLVSNSQSGNFLPLESLMQYEFQSPSLEEAMAVFDAEVLALGAKYGFTGRNFQPTPAEQKITIYCRLYCFDNIKLSEGRQVIREEAFHPV